MAHCLISALVFVVATAKALPLATNETSRTALTARELAIGQTDEQRQFKICNTRSAPSTIHYRAVTYDGFWGKSSVQYDVILDHDNCSYPQNINDDYLKVWWEAFGSGSCVMQTGYALWLTAKPPNYLVTEYSQNLNDVKVKLKFTTLWSNAASLPGSTYDFSQQIHHGWKTDQSISSETKAAIDASMATVLEGFTPKLDASVSREVQNSVTVSAEESEDTQLKIHFDLSKPQYLYQAEIDVDAPGYLQFTGFGGYFVTPEPLPPMPSL